MRNGNVQRFLVLSALILSVGLLRAETPPSFAKSPPSGEYRLRLYQIHTGERLDIVYRRENSYIPESIAKLDYFLRDYRTGEVRHFDPRLYDLLERLTLAVHRPGIEVDVVCGYRTPSSNEFLRAHTEGVAKNSLHMQAQAIDLRIPGIDTRRLRETALVLRGGGVGYYPRSDFVHVDVGRLRHWCFDCSANDLSVN